MKYIFNPIFDFVITVAITIGVAIYNVLHIVIVSIWEGKLDKGFALEVKEVPSHTDPDTCLSRYVKIPPRGIGSYYYKTYYHYLWGKFCLKRELK